MLTREKVFYNSVLCLALSCYGCKATQESTEVLPPVHRGEQDQWGALVNGSGWKILQPEKDPFWEHATDRVRCRETDFGEEYGGLEISTSYCSYLTLSQGLLTSIHRGDRIEMSAWHSSLVSTTPSEGLMALYLEGELLWTKQLSIPANAESWTIQFLSPVDAPMGALLFFHISNHGSNHYTLYTLKVENP